MNQATSDSLVSIDCNRTIELHDASDTELVCVRGCLWMHEDRPGDDRLLRPGESRCIGARRRTLVTALAPSLVCILRSPWYRGLPSADAGLRHEVAD